jgi:hypothetical protein
MDLVDLFNTFILILESLLCIDYPLIAYEDYERIESISFSILRRFFIISGESS